MTCNGKRTEEMTLERSKKKQEDSHGEFPLQIIRGYYANIDRTPRKKRKEKPEEERRRN